MSEVASTGQGGGPTGVARGRLKCQRSRGRTRRRRCHSRRCASPLCRRGRLLPPGGRWECFLPSLPSHHRSVPVREGNVLPSARGFRTAACPAACDVLRPLVSTAFSPLRKCPSKTCRAGFSRTWRDRDLSRDLSRDSSPAIRYPLAAPAIERDPSSAGLIFSPGRSRLHRRPD